MIKLIALDMDGTLLNEKKELKQPQIDAIHQAIEAGVKIVLCTGRPLAGVKPFVEQLGFDTEEEFVIVNNGCSTHSTKDWSLIDWAELTPADISHLNQLADGKDLQISLFDVEDYFVLAEEANEQVKLDATLVDMVPQPIGLDEATSGQHRFFEAMFVGKPEVVERFEQTHRAGLEQTYSTVRSLPYLLEILPQGTNKASALARLAEELGIEASQIMAIGDGNNDLEMIEFSGLGIAMGNANEQVKAIAQDITDTNENNGVAKAIEKHILNK